MSLEKLLEQHDQYDRERFGTIEKRLDEGNARINKMDEKLDILVAAAHKQRGFIAGAASLASALVTTIVGLVVYIWQKHFGG